MNLQLTHERIDAMRARVLSSVDDDINRRGRRARKAIASGAGALALATVLGVSIPSLTHGPARQTTSHAAADGGVVTSVPEASQPGIDGSVRSELGKAAPNADYAAKSAPDVAGGVEPVPPEPSPLTAPGKDREVVTTGSASVTVHDTAKAADRFTAWVEKHGGRVDGRSEVNDHDGNASADLTARIPSRYVSGAVAELRKEGDVGSVDLERADVTAQGADLDGRIKALKISVGRLESILERAGSSSQVIEAETALSDRQQELQSLQLQRRSLDDQVSLSTISVTFTQEGKPGAVAPGGFRGGLIKGWNALVDTVNAIVTATGAALPWVGIGLLFGLAWWGIRRIRRS